MKVHKFFKLFSIENLVSESDAESKKQLKRRYHNSINKSSRNRLFSTDLTAYHYDERIGDSITGLGCRGHLAENP